jgi:hypothetical protein
MTARHPLALILASIVLLFPGCDGSTPLTAIDDEEEEGEEATTGVDLVSPDSLVTLSVPPGAVPEGTTLTIEETVDEAALMAVGRVYVLGPAGTQFAEPATLRLMLPFEPAEVHYDLTGEDLTLARIEDGNWTPLPTTWEAETRTLSAPVDHLSVFGAAPDIYVPPYNVRDEQPYWLWADEWYGFIARVEHFEEGTLPPGPYHMTLRAGAMGLLSEDPDEFELVLDRRAASWRVGTVFWQPAASVRSAYAQVRVPSPDHTCPGITTILGEGGEAQGLAPSAETGMNLSVTEQGYRIAFAEPEGQTVPVEWVAGCIVTWEVEEAETNYVIAEGTKDVEVRAFEGFLSGPFPEEDYLFDVDEEGSGPNRFVRQFTTLIPEHHVRDWGDAYQAYITSTEGVAGNSFGRRHENWVEIQERCDKGELRGIICRAARRAVVRNVEVRLLPWIDDCRRLQRAILDEEHAPLLSRSEVYDAVIVEGPVEFCRFTHRLLWSFVPAELAERYSPSLVTYHRRLPEVLRVLYSMSDLEVLYPPPGWLPANDRLGHEEASEFRRQLNRRIQLPGDLEPTRLRGWLDRFPQRFQ